MEGRASEAPVMLRGEALGRIFRACKWSFLRFMNADQALKLWCQLPTRAVLTNPEDTYMMINGSYFC